MEALLGLEVVRARVVREGRSRELDARELVPGDVILLEAGQTVPADARLLQSAELRTVEASLTGEPGSVSKSAVEAAPADAPIADRPTMVYKTTSVVAGTARAVVVATGMATEVGRIGELAEAVVKARTPLERRLDALGRRLARRRRRGRGGHRGAGRLAGRAARSAAADGHRARGGGGAGGAAGRRHDRDGGGRPAHGPPPRAHPAPAGGRDAGVRLRHLHRQDRHAHGRSDDGDGAPPGRPRGGDLRSGSRAGGRIPGGRPPGRPRRGSGARARPPDRGARQRGGAPPPGRQCGTPWATRPTSPSSSSPRKAGIEREGLLGGVARGPAAAVLERAHADGERSTGATGRSSPS